MLRYCSVQDVDVLNEVWVMTLGKLRYLCEGFSYRNEDFQRRTSTVKRNI